MHLHAPTRPHTSEHTHIWTWFALTLVKTEFSDKYPLQTRALHTWVLIPYVKKSYQLISFLFGGENGPSSFLWYFALLWKLKSLSILSELDKLEQGMKNGWYVWLWTHRSIVSTQMRFRLGIKPTRIPYPQLTFWYNVQKKSRSWPHH